MIRIAKVVRIARWILVWGSAVTWASSPSTHAPSAGGQAFFNRVRKLYLRRDDIAQVHTALGIATLIQVPDRPTSVVLGDTNAFKIEYLDTAVTLKPLSRSSQSNLYIYTEARRYNVSLVTGGSIGADYVVYLNPKLDPDPSGYTVRGDSQAPLSSPPSRIRWKASKERRSSKSLSFLVRRIAKDQDYLLIEFEVTATQARRFSAGWIWVTQQRKTIPIERLSLSQTEMRPQLPIQALLVLKCADLRSDMRLFLELRPDPEPSLRIPLAEPNSWNR